ncbi:hypothetical protein M5X00_17350 [Paenibacillus alvei]|uniref:Phage protein n=1 Tax=Paenibacillus alvei TaxID=44250 RepID=A0ABT4H5F9_PAEAL|nr:hypothetical protein [Paenibacillus alvei]EJW19178.1 hypothetical protein PAV_1c01490 [Paenibacillus alvei DSM 29]MCY9544232.1 hypothetical protein [Paenibacillus alvei]MCY9706342.1 hypothetical protein [Paenibacillus alvei]MCY9732222.1 hypothetical protein [Paenibacillus alvei]MCY9756006.1 hypothetical protein [Paenibacillus alvei]
MSQNIERELGWDDEIVKDGGDFVLLPEGDYNFTVTKFERGRFTGSDKMPACNQAKLELKIHCPQNGDVTIFHNLFLHTKTEGLLSAFFSAIGQKKKGEPLRMNWNAVIGAKGRCQIEHHKYKKDGRELVNNQVKRFYPYDEYLKQVQGNAIQPQQTQQSYQQQPQQQYNQPPQQQAQYQAPFPTNQQGGGFTPGQF